LAPRRPSDQNTGDGSQPPKGAIFRNLFQAQHLLRLELDQVDLIIVADGTVQGNT